MDKENKARYIVFLPFIVAFLIEILVFNFRTFESMLNREIVLSADNLDVQGAVDYGEGVYRITGEGEKAVVYLTGLNVLLQGSRFDNVKLDIFLPEAEDVSWRESGCMYITPYVRDGGHDRYDILADHVYRQDVEDSKFLWITPAGELKTLALNISLSEGSVFQIKSIKLNAKRDLHISFPRLLILGLLAYACYLLRRSSGLWEKDSIKKSVGNEIIAAVFGICLILPGMVINISDNGIYGNNFRPYQHLAEALADGHLYLNEIPSEKLGLIDNPYDLTLREAEGIEMDTDYLWDMAYYNGKYYCYFGVVPCILFYLPVYLLAGVHLSDGLLMMILAAFIYAGIYLAMREWMKKHAASVPFAWLLLLTCMIFMGSGMIANLSAPDAHDIPRAAGLAFLSWGLYLWQHSVRTDKRGLMPGCLAGGSLCMALAVGCRPNQLLYSFMAIPLFWPYIKTGEGFEKKDRNKAIAALLIPYIPVAVGLMAYNALRFGSVTDFGYDYQLTVLDYSKKNILIDRIVIGLYEFLVRLPRMTYSFPFMEVGNFVQENAFGHGSFYYTYGCGGILSCNLITWFIPAVFLKKRDKGAIWLLVLSAVNMMLNICVAGVTDHYRVDFAPVILAVGAIGIIRLRSRLGKDAEALLRVVLITAFALSILYHSCFYYTGNMNMADTAMYYRVSYAWLG